MARDTLVCSPMLVYRTDLGYLYSKVLGGQNMPSLLTCRTRDRYRGPG